MKKCLSILTVVLIGIFLLMLCTFLIINGGVNTKFIAHRGFGGFDNSLSNFENSKKFYGIECDVRLTNDGKFVVSHDKIIETTTGIVDISQTNFENLIEMTLKNGKQLCSFKDYLECCKKLKKLAMIELKDELNQNSLSNLVNEIDLYYNRTNCVIISFISSNLLKLKENYNFVMCLLFDDNIEQSVNFCIKNNIHASIGYKNINKSIVSNLHKNNLKVCAWTVNSKIDIKRLKMCDVDYIVSDKYCN